MRQYDSDMPLSPVSVSSSSSLDGPASSSSSSKATTLCLKRTRYSRRISLKYSGKSTNTNAELDYAPLDEAKVNAAPLVAADDLIVRIFDDPRHRLNVRNMGRKICEHSMNDRALFKNSFRAAFKTKMKDPQLIANLFTKRMQDQGLVENDEQSASAFSNLSLRYAQLKFHSSRVEISRVVIREELQSRIVATSDIPRRVVIHELGGLLSANSVESTTASGGNRSHKRKEIQQQEFNMFSVVRIFPGQCGPGRKADRLLVGPVRFVNHSCEPNCKFKLFPQKHAVGIETLRDILAGEEVTINYGKQYFGPGECACASCQVVRPGTDAPASREHNNPYPTPSAEPENLERPRKRARTSR